MDERAARFLEAWFQANIAERALSSKVTARVLARCCRAAARKEGLTKEDLEAVVVDLEQAIADELEIKKSLPPAERESANPLHGAETVS